jgi:antitoxin (DNA-binding transcriptional repressor) of toxin-antitoxin stability system
MRSFNMWYARKNLRRLLEDVGDGKRVVTMRRGKPMCAMIPVNHLDTIRNSLVTVTLTAQ